MKQDPLGNTTETEPTVDESQMARLAASRGDAGVCCPS
jgi:hypothetical protein